MSKEVIADVMRVVGAILFLGCAAVLAVIGAGMLFQFVGPFIFALITGATVGVTINVLADHIAPYDPEKEAGCSK